MCWCAKPASRTTKPSGSRSKLQRTTRGAKSACPLADTSGRGSLGADSNLLTCLSLQQLNFKHAIAERRVDLVWVNGPGQIQNEEDLISLPFGIHGLSLLALRPFLALATDKEAARRNSYLKVPLPEPRHLDTNGKLRFRLSDIHRTAAQDFRLSAKPVLQLMAMGKSSGLRQFISTTRDQLFDLLHALEERVTCKKFEDFWRAKKFCWGFHPRFSFQENLSSANCYPRGSLSRLARSTRAKAEWLRYSTTLSRAGLLGTGHFRVGPSSLQVSRPQSAFRGLGCFW